MSCGTPSSYCGPSTQPPRYIKLLDCVSWSWTSCRDHHVSCSASLKASLDSVMTCSGCSQLISLIGFFGVLGPWRIPELAFYSLNFCDS
ncbi:hypothetical protein SISSUDRAFT_691427 [Sistotremastrum suecicum HHB10207 ss-3]|uniref:Uncharacterized protein n=1 Tax=Sistotremastrum suecicum HHB10207 ss-3 TaxID=1314776 RepID=A0A166I4I7_9AGAM|nr:hypothetical protein SISSUDRAFT_691427 [Sistotremastrum suecicum HHB10207 ss-3]